MIPNPIDSVPFAGSKVQSVAATDKQALNPVSHLALSNLPKFNFFINEYTYSRGVPAMLSITCKKCNEWVMNYQKDGPGPLLRCYTDRIHEPADLRVNSFSEASIESAGDLACNHCQSLLGKPMIYRRTENSALNKVNESRPAYLVALDENIQDASNINYVVIQ